MVRQFEFKAPLSMSLETRMIKLHTLSRFDSIQNEAVRNSGLRLLGSVASYSLCSRTKPAKQSG